MANPVGVTVIERPAATAPAIIPADVTNTGMLIESQRGLVNKPVNLASISLAQLRFGIPQPSLGRYGVLAIRGLFRNAAPFTARLFVSRIVGAGSDAAEATFISGDTQFAAKAGGPGTPADYTVTIETATTEGKKFTFKDDAGSPTVTEVFDDVTTPQQLADAVNRGLLGFGSGSIADGDPSGLIVVNYVGGVLPDNLTETALGGGLLLDALVAAAVDSIIAAGQLGLEDPGVWGNDVRVTFTPSVGAEYLRDVEVVEIVNGENISRETFTNLGFDSSLSNFWSNVLNSPDVGSNFVAVNTLGDIPNPVTLKVLAGGLDGADPVLSDFIGSETLGTGLFAFDGEPINIVTTPDLTSVEMADAMEEYAAGRGDVVAVASTDLGLSIDTLETDWSPVLFKQKSFLSVYRSWIQMDDGAGGRVLVPNVGHVIGAGYVRRMLSKSQFPHIAPAGLDIDVRDALDLEFRNLSQTQLDRLVNEVGINPIMFVANRGFVIRTSRTFSSLSPNFSVHIRRSLNFVIRTLNDNLGFLEQEPNNDTTRGRVRQVLTAFFTTLFNAGMFETRGGFANNIAVKCDEENNPISVVNERKLVVDITLRFVEIAQTIEVNLQATREGIVITEVAA